MINPLYLIIVTTACHTCQKFGVISVNGHIHLCVQHGSLGCLLVLLEALGSFAEVQRVQANSDVAVPVPNRERKWLLRRNNHFYSRLHFYVCLYLLIEGSAGM